MAIRRAAKVDRNQPEIVSFFRKAGCSVAVTSSAHDGFPDLVVGFGGLTVLVEVKYGELPQSRQQLTPKQVDFFNEFKGAKTVVSTLQEAQRVVSVLKEASGSIDIDWQKKFVKSC
jgi:Holliday junction resolvase